MIARSVANNRCKLIIAVTESKEDAAEENAQVEKGYFCSDCQMTLELTGISLLRHQKKHQQEKLTDPQL